MFKIVIYIFLCNPHWTERYLGVLYKPAVDYFALRNYVPTELYVRIGIPQVILH
jgi:hypothetical protein